MIELTHIPRILFAAVAAVLVSACQSDNGALQLSNDSVSVTPPSLLLNARNVNRDALSPFVSLNNGTEITMTPNADNVWSGETLVVPNSTYRVTVEWREELPERALVLAILVQDVFVGPQGEVLQNIASSQYSTNLDFDGDSFTNLEERELGSDPFSFDSVPDNITPIEPVTPVTPPAPQTDPTITPDPDTDPDTDPETDPDTIPDTTPEPTQPSSDEVTVLIPRIAASNAPQVDGLGVVELASDGSLLGEWSAAVQFDLNGVPLGINRLMIDNGTDEDDNDPHRRWAAMHDGERIYVLVLVDDVGLRHGDSELDVWNDDALEVFIDGDNSKNVEWGDEDDFQYLVPVITENGDPTTTDDDDEGRILVGRQASTADIDFYVATGPGIGPDGIRQPRWEQDVYEFSFDLAAAGIEIGEPFGFELQVDDDDNGNTRDAKWGWFHPARVDTNTDLTYQNPSIMGTVELEE